ncbi:MAG: M1 family aminopeptidase [Brevefilum sp.]|nr:M1 family aminopeptidase [Brevefilum sp.]
MKKDFQNAVVLLLLVMLIIGCRGLDQDLPTQTSVPTETSTSTAAPVPTDTPLPTPTSTPLPLNGQQTQYDIELNINYYNRFITARSRSLYTNKTQFPINEMIYIIYPTIFQSAIYVKSIELGNGTPVSNFRWDGHRMVIPLNTPLMPGEQIEFVHDFELYMPNRGGTFGQTDHQLNLSYWFPMIPPRTEEGWDYYEISLVNSQFIGENFFFENADFNVRLAFTDRAETMKVAAGVLPREEDDMLLYEMKLARTFTLSISDVYVIAERDVLGTKILSYTFPEEASAGEAAADLAVDTLKLFTEYYGPVMRDLVTIVEADFEHNMEFDGLIFISRGIFMFYNGTPETNLTIITPHEVSHQWFYSLVGNNQAVEPWLDESIATYSEALFYEHYYPELVSWWWANRVDGHQPSGYVDNTIYLEAGYEAYRNSVYLNGAHFMQDLRDTIGDQAFFDFINAYAHEYRYQIASSEDFFSTLSRHTSEDLTILFEEYFANPPTMPET